jgi:HSP20 family protein
MSGSVNENAQASVERVKHEVERWIEVARTAGERTLEAIGLSAATRCSLPAVDVLETSDAVEVWVDVPGLSSDAVQLATSETQVTIKLTRPAAAEFPGNYRLRERPQTSCERHIPLPASVRPDQTTAQLHEGVLRITLPKQHVTSSRSVPVSIVR